ncbi:hypothetical protein ACFQ1O_03675 [Pseudofulvibacter geojedonensis]|uniref:Uncharacterized protein n=1 Tax=Pseudofulvibacter geojedonensis TaxID=1123758 RepID=A0ABW3I053_9FLAO
MLVLFAQENNDLTNVFKNCLISDRVNNLKRLNPIEIIEFDETNNRIKTNYSQLYKLKLKATSNKSWFITQGEEGSNIAEILEVDTLLGWITLGKTYQGVLNLDIGERIEFFNPFINYEIINNRPLFKSYPNYIDNNRIGYIQTGGIIKRSSTDYVLLTPVVFRAHKSRSVYFATSSNLTDWNFNYTPLVSSKQIGFAKPNGNVFSTGNPLQLKNGNYLVLLGVELENGNYSSCYMLIDENLHIIQPPKQIKLKGWYEEGTNSFPLSITYFNGLYRLLLHKRDNNVLETEIYEYTSQNIISLLDKGSQIESINKIHSAKKETGYLHGKADDASYLIYKNNLYILIGSEESPSEYLTSLNREYGLMNLKNNTWLHDKRSPIIVNPINLNHKYPEYDWCNDHLGGFISPIIHNDYLYIFLSFGTDNPDYLISGIKVKI